MAYVYILESVNDGRYYIGSTIDLKNRLRHHRGGFTHSTKRFGDLELVLAQKYSSIEDAREIEMRLKKLKRKDYLKKMVNEGCIKMQPKK